MLVDHEREWHELGEQPLKRPEGFLAGIHHARRQRQTDGAVYARHAECRILDRLDQSPPALAPSLDARLVEQVPRQSVHFAHASGVRVRLGVEVVRGEVVAAGHDQSVEIALVARHAVQRLHGARDGEIWQQLVISIH